MKIFIFQLFLFTFVWTQVYSSEKTFDVYTEDFPPYNFKEGNEIKGISSDIVKELFKRTGYQPNFKHTSWTDAYQTAQKKEHSLLYSVTRSPSRENLFQWVGPIVPIKLVLLKRANNPLKLNSLKDARQVNSIGVYADDYGEQLLQQKKFKNLKRANTLKENLQRLLNGTIDLWVVNEPTGNFLAEEMNALNKISRAYLLQEESMYLCFHKNFNTVIVEKFRKALEQMHYDKSFQHIIDSWSKYLNKQDQKTLQLKNKITISCVKNSGDVIAAKNVLKEAYRRIGHQVVFKKFSATDALQASNSGELDAELQRISGTEESYTNLLRLPIPINYITGAVYTNNIEFPISGWHSLRPYKIGIVKGILFAMKGTKGMNVNIFNSYSEMFSALNNGNIEVSVLPRINGNLQLSKHSAKSNLKVLDGDLEMIFLYHFLHKKNQHLYQPLKKTLKRMLLDGTIRSIREMSYSKELLK